MSLSEREILDFIEDNNVKFIKLSFCDAFGRQRIISVIPSVLMKVLDTGLMVDASKIDCFRSSGENSVQLYPDMETMTLLPWRPSHGRVARVYCNLRDKNGKRFSLDSRGILARAVRKAEEKGITLDFSAENEFYLFKMDEDGNSENIPFDTAGYMDEAPEDKGEDVRRDICLTLEDMGIEPQSSHHTYGPGQNRIDFTHGTAFQCADNVMTFRSVVKAMASRNGLCASFSPKPLSDCAGSSFRIKINPLQRGMDCSEEFIAGILCHIGEITLFLNNSEESYKRLGTFGAPFDISVSDFGGSALIQRKNNGSFILTSPDAGANPYLAFAVLIYAGLDGIEKMIKLKDVCEESSANHKTLPANLERARLMCAESDFVKGILPKELIKAYTSTSKV